MIGTIPSGYDAANRTVAAFDRSARVRIEAAGPDRAKMLHNLTTNDIKRINPQHGREAFLTNGQGKTLAFLTIHNLGETLLIRADEGSAEPILAHTAKYGVFDDATLVDLSAQTIEVHIVGPLTVAHLAALGLKAPEDDLEVEDATLDGMTIHLIRERPTGRDGVTLIARGGAAPAVDRIVAGVVRLDPLEFEALRIEAGTPVFGRDVTPANLPQEVGRDARAISFVKGCYLGQETVARLDALGHVNKILFAAISDDERAPAVAARLFCDGKDVGVVTSSAYSPGVKRGVVLGVARVAATAPGVKLSAGEGGDAIGLTAHALPIRV